MTQVPETRVKGLIPAIDRRQAQERYVMSGRNFLVNAKGPYSAFSSEDVTYHKIVNPEYVQTFRVGNNIIMFTSEGAFSYDDMAKRLTPLYVLDTPAIEEFPWSSALVGGLYYFVKKGSPLIQHNHTTNAWKEITAHIPPVPHGVANAGGRLVVVGEDLLSWSEISNGENLNPAEVDKGIGAQSLALIGGGDVLGVFPTANGVLTFTTKGIMRSELIQQVLLTFNHYPLSGTLQAINPYVIVSTNDEEVIFLTKTGFYITRGDRPEVYQPLMSEYFRSTLLKEFGNQLSNPTLIRLTYNADFYWLIVSIATSEKPYDYDQGFVLYIPMDEWGVFNRSHTGFGEMSLNLQINEGFNFGYICARGCLHRFINDAKVETVNYDTHDLYFSQNPVEIAARLDNGGYIFGTDMRLSVLDETFFSVAGLQERVSVEGVFSLETTVEDWTEAVETSPIIFTTNMSMLTRLVEVVWRPYQRQFIGLDSSITVGPFRVTAGERHDELSLLLGLTIGTKATASDVTDIDDWQLSLIDIIDDWELGPEEIEDWGLGLLSSSEFDLTVTGSLDSYNIFEDQEENPELELETENSKYFTCYNNGIYHILKLETVEVGEFFELQILDLNLIPSGVLNG